MIKKRLLVLVLLLVVSWGTLIHPKATSAAASEKSQVGIYFDEISPNPPPAVGDRPSKLPQTSNNHQSYLQIAGLLLLTSVGWGKGWFSLKRGGRQ